MSLMTAPPLVPATTVQSPKTSLGDLPLSRVVVVLIVLVGVLPFGFDLGFSFEVSPADVCAILLFPYVAIGITQTPLFRWFAFIVLASFIVIVLWALWSGTSAQPPLLSMAFFFKPWVFFFAAYKYVANSPSWQLSALLLLRIAAWAQVVLLAVIYLAWLDTGFLTIETRTDFGLGTTSFTGGIWDRPLALYGYGQVNTIAGLVALSIPLFLHRVFQCRALMKLFWLALVPAAWNVILQSGSRGAIVACVTFLVVALVSRGSTSGTMSYLQRLVVAIVLAIIIASQGAAILALSPKYAKTVQAIRDGQAAEVSSGRDRLAWLMLSDLKQSPVVGTGFGDFRRFHTERDTMWIDSSPHNAYLGALHKMGIPIGFSYLFLLLRSFPLYVRSSLRGGSFLGRPLALSVAIGLLPFIDALTTPVLGGSMLLLFGIMSAVGDRERTQAEGAPLSQGIPLGGVVTGVR